MPAKLKDSSIVSGLRDVFEFLINRHSIQDDSVLHSLVDLIGIHLVTRDCIQDSGLVDFIDNVKLHCEDLDAGVVSCAFQVITSLWKQKDVQPHLASTVYHLFEAVRSNENVFSNITIKTAYFECLHGLLDTDNGLAWIVDNHKDYLTDVFVELESGASIFLEKAAENLLAAFISRDIEASVPGTRNVLHCKEEVWTIILQHIHTHVVSGAILTIASRVSLLSRRLALCCLKVLQTACQTSDTVTYRCVHTLQLISDIKNMILSPDITLSQQALDLLTVWLKKSSQPAICMLDDCLDLLQSQGNKDMLTKLAATRLKCCAEHNERCKEIVLSPIKTLLASVQSKDKGDIGGHSKSNVTKGISSALRVLCDTKVVVPGIISQLFMLTCGGSTKLTHDQTYVAIISKLQILCMEYFLNLSDVAVTERDLIVPTLLTLLGAPDLDTLVYTSWVQCFLPHCAYVVKHEEHAATLGCLLQRHLCALKWSIRDTTLEFLSKLLERYSCDVAVMTWFCHQKLPAHIWSCVSDGESYVRASALKALTSMLSAPEVWTQLPVMVTKTEDQILETILGVFQNDTEAFARRAAGIILSDLFTLRPEGLQHTCILTAMQQAVNDFDWEVKLLVVKFLTDYIVQEMSKCAKMGLEKVPTYAANLTSTIGRENPAASTQCTPCTFQNLHASRSLSSLLQAADDYDQSVCTEACQSIVKIKELISKFLKNANSDNSINNSVDDSQASSLNGKIEHSGDVSLLKSTSGSASGSQNDGVFGETKTNRSDQTVDVRLSLYNKIVHLLARHDIHCLKAVTHSSNMESESGCTDEHKTTDHSETVTRNTSSDASGSTTDRHKSSCVEADKVADQPYIGQNEVIGDCLLIFLTFDSEKNSTQASSGCDYTSNPLSLIQDILSYANKPEEDNNIDCY